MDAKIERDSIEDLMNDRKNRKIFIEFAVNVAKKAIKRNA
jgi:hypothetical protein